MQQKIDFLLLMSIFTKKNLAHMIFQGTGVALVTPFNTDGSIDYNAFSNLIEYVIAGGVDFLVALGTTAETPTLTTTEKKDILQFVIDKNNQRKPLVVGIGGNNTQEIIDTIQAYPTKDIDGILSVVPYYNKPSQEGIYQHFKAIAQSTDKPIILYNVPGRTVTNMLPNTALRLANDFKNIVAIKEASGNMAQCMDLVQNAPKHFSILSGDDELILPQIAVGMTGVISVAANCYPKTFTTMVQQALQQDFISAQTLHYQLLPAIRLLFAEGNPTGVKYVLAQKGILQNALRLPLLPATEGLQQAFQPYIKAL
jgi:4-hydroxy-tetrahydrodipicolinate synthase